MKKMEIVANYGVLAHEKKPVYTHGAEHMHASCSEKIAVKLPAGWDIAQNDYGMQILVDQSGKTWDISDILSSGKDGDPILSVPVGPWERKYYALEIISE